MIDDQNNQPAIPAGIPESTTSVADFPGEAFPCPACGQMLAPTCRVCVACKQPIDPAAIARTPQPAAPADQLRSAEPRPEVVRYPWPLFFIVLGCSFFVGLIVVYVMSAGLMTEKQTEMAVHGASTLVGIWVFYDALRRRIPRPLRWGVGTMLLLAIVLPWYLARRSKPKATVPFVEAEVGPVTRLVLFALLLLVLASLIFSLVKAPQSTSPPSSRPKLQKTGDGPPSRIAGIDLRKIDISRRHQL